MIRNQRLQGALGALALVGVGWLMGAAGDGEVRGRRFVLEDKYGKVRAELGPVDGAPLLRFFDPDGKVRYRIGLGRGVDGKEFPYQMRLDPTGRGVDEKTGQPARGVVIPD